MIRDEDKIEKMVNRFLSWRLPSNFHPDGGIAFYKPDFPHWPTGTNLFDYSQTLQMVLHITDGLLGPVPPTPVIQVEAVLCDVPGLRGSTVVYPEEIRQNEDGSYTAVVRLDDQDIFPEVEPTEDEANESLTLLMTRYVLKNLHHEHPDCGYGKMAEACERAAFRVVERYAFSQVVREKRDAV